MHRMRQLTLGIPPEMDKALERERNRRGSSLDEVVIQLLRGALGMNRRRPQRNDLARLAGTWTEEEHAQFEAAIAPMEQIDEELWR